MARELATAGRILLLAVVAALLAGCEATDIQPLPPVADLPTTVPPSPTGPGATPSPASVRMDPLSGASPSLTGPGAYRYRVDVPQVDGVGAHGPAIDGAIRGAIQRAIDAFEDQARSAPAGPSPSELACAGRTMRLTARLAVLRVDCSQRLAGADHPDAITHSFNCDLVGGRVLALQDLFSSGSGYLDAISAAARTQLRSSLPPGDDRTLDDGTAPVVDNFKTFLLDRLNLVVVLPSRYRAAGVTAPPEVSVPYTDLQRYLARGVTDLLTS